MSYDPHTRTHRDWRAFWRDSPAAIAEWAARVVNPKRIRLWETQWNDRARRKGWMTLPAFRAALAAGESYDYHDAEHLPPPSDA